MEFEKIYTTYFRDVFLYIRRLSNNEHIAEEITSETFFKAMNSIDSFRGDCDIRVWLCQIAKNLYISQIRKKRMISLEDMDAVPNQISSTNIEQEYIQKEDKLSVYKVLHFLDEPYKEIFLLRTLGDLSFKEIADVFHRTESWARVTYHRARLKIQEALEQK